MQRKKKKKKTLKTANICTLEFRESNVFFVVVVTEVGGQEKKKCCMEVPFVSLWKMSVLPLNSEN